MLSVAVTNTAKVGVAFCATAVVTTPEVGAVGLTQTPVVGFVSHKLRRAGTSALVVAADTVSVSDAPKLKLATLNAAAFVLDGTATTPSAEGVAARAIRSATGELDAENVKVFTPVMVPTSGALSQIKASFTSVEAITSKGVIATTKLCEPPAGIETSAFAWPVDSLVNGSVVW